MTHSPIVTFPEVLGAVIRYRRKKLGLNQTSFSASVDLSASNWSRIENGQVQLTVVQLRATAKALGCEAWEMLKEVEVMCERILETSVCEILPERPTSEQALEQWFLGGAAVGALVAKFMSEKSKRHRQTSRRR